MSEVSIVSNVVLKLIGVAIALGFLGTLGDHIFAVKEKTKHSILNDQISYGVWNRKLLNEKKTE